MKRILILISIFLIFSTSSFSQKDSIATKPIIEIFTDFHVNLTPNDSYTTGFSLNRAYFGYSYVIDKNFFAVLILNVGSPDELAAGSKPRRYAFFREASMNYSNDKLTLTMGMVKTKTYMFQQGWWGMRYITKPFQDLNGYGTDSDLGLEATYKFNDMFEADLSLLNGEGGGNLQLDNNLKSSGGLTFKPSDKITFRLYGDLMKNKVIWQNTSLLFAGYKTERFFLGCEFNYKTNLDTISGHNAWGISATGGVNLAEKFMVFSRYDLSRSVVPPGIEYDWNYKKDGSFLILGIQYAVSKAVRVAVDYQSHIPDDTSKTTGNLIFLNLVMKI
jgi:hypothetical protein